MIKAYVVKQIDFEVEGTKSNIVEYFTKERDANALANFLKAEKGGTFIVQSIKIYESREESRI